jgi:hypothetical protein
VKSNTQGLMKYNKTPKKEAITIRTNHILQIP